MIARTLLLVFVAAFALALGTLHFAPAAGGTQAAAVDVRGDTTAEVLLPRIGPTAELVRDLDGHFRADVRLNGQPVRMLVDSGASMIVIDEALAQRLGIAPHPSAYTGTAMTANGEASFAPVRIASVQIGDVTRIDVPAGVMRGVALPTPLLGQSFLGTLAEVNIASDRMTLK